MAFPPRAPLIPGVQVGQPYALTTAANLIPAGCLPTVQSLTSIPTPIGHHRAPIAQMIGRANAALHLPPRVPHLRLGIPTRQPILTRPHNFSAVPPPGTTVVTRPLSFSQRIESTGPPVTVFVGNITEKAPDVMIRHILNSCGPVLSWKRVQGASGKLQGFGFCEFGGPDAALRAIRLLHEYEIAGSKLVVKADAKTMEVLDEFKEKAKKSQNGNAAAAEGSPLQDEKKEEPNSNDYMDEVMKKNDEVCMQRVDMILLDHRKDIVNYIPPQSKQDVRDKRMNKVQEKLVALSSGAELSIPSLNLQEIEDVEEGKRDIISREIVLFREMMKKQEEERERDRKEREKIKERLLERSRERRKRSRSSSPRRSKSRSESVEAIKHTRKEKHRSRTKSRSPSKKSSKTTSKDKEREDEDKEKKEQDRKIRKKEMQYQERLRNWESREHKKEKELKRESERKKQRDSDRERDARKLREFLEDYDDERDDHKYYKGHSFQRKWSMRESEMDSDAKDRVKEKEELEELRSKILSEGHENPDEAYEMAKKEREEQYKPQIVIKPVFKPVVTIDDTNSRPPSPKELPPADSPEVIPPPDLSQANGSPESDDDGSVRSMGFSQPQSPEENSVSKEVSPVVEEPPQPPKKKKLDVKDVFNQDDDDSPSKKKKLPLLGKDRTKEKGGEEKRKHIKSLIDKIPTSKAELFAYPIDSSLVDNTLMEKRIRPWINKKIIEYIGEPEPSLVEFICSKVLSGSEPQSLLNDVQMVLDDEADVFVVKMWRLLIYEIEAKKMGLAKT